MSLTYNKPATAVKHTPMGACRHFGCVVFQVSVLVAVTGCAPQQGVALDHAYRVYEAGDYAGAYSLALKAERQGSQTARHNAAYVAGLSAYQLNDLPTAARYLTRSAHSSDPKLSGDSMASLGMVYGQMGRHDQAVKVLLRAAAALDGQDAANAYFYAAMTQHKIGQWPQARTNLVLARSLSTDPAFRRQVNRELNVTGYTLQTGAYAKTANAQQAVERLAGRALSLHLGRPRVVQSVTANGRPLSLVQVGRFGNYSGALAARRRLGMPNAIIVPVTSQ